MRASFIVPAMLAAFIVTVAVPAPASATNISQAIKLCQKNPDCSMRKTKDGAVFCLKGTGGCAHEIVCLNKRGCIVASAKARNAGRVGPILTGTATGGERKIVAAMHGPRGHTSSTYQDGPRKVVRDHRGQSGSQSPTYPGGASHRGGGGGRR